MKRTALLIGATGGVGGETAAALLRHGWDVRALHRNPDQARRQSPELGVTWVKGDAMDAASVLAAALGAGGPDWIADVIVHGANPPGYRNWKGTAVPMLESTIAAAERVGARIVFPGTVYNYAPDTFPRVAEDAPQAPVTRKGKIRAEMERRLEASKARVLIVRAGDFFGPRVANSWFAQGLVKPNRPLASVMYPGAREVGHAWAYLPDLAETFARLLDREDDLPRFARFHFRGHHFARGVEIAEAARHAAGVPDAPIRAFPWFAVYLLSPFVETFRELIEMRYLWKQDLELVNDELVAFLGAEPHTRLETALRETLRGMGVLPAASPSISEHSKATRLAS